MSCRSLKIIGTLGLFLSLAAPSWAQLPGILYKIGDAIDPTQRGGPLYRNPSTESTVGGPDYRRSNQPTPRPQTQKYRVLRMRNSGKFGNLNNIAIHYFDTVASRWVTNGYWNLAPGEEVCILGTNGTSTIDWFFLHIESSNGTYWGKPENSFVVPASGTSEPFFRIDNLPMNYTIDW